MGLENGEKCKNRIVNGDPENSGFSLCVHGKNTEKKTKFYLGNHESDGDTAKMCVQNNDLVLDGDTCIMGNEEKRELKCCVESTEDEEENSKFLVESQQEEDEVGSRFYVYYITCCATMGGLLFGYDTGIISGSMLIIEVKFQLTTIWKEIIVSATVGAAAVFALIAGNLTDWLGRKKVVMFASVLFTAGAVVMGIAPNKRILLIGRIISGTGLGKIFCNIKIFKVL
jgi:SP family myo-inositol transporter-like MFS transporter 13